MPPVSPGVVLAVLAVGDTGVNASLCGRYGAPHGASCIAWLERSLALAWVTEATYARCFLSAPCSSITGP